MQTELEIKFYIKDIATFKKDLLNLKAKLESEEQLYRRVVFNIPKSLGIKNGWARVRDEGDKVTMSIKVEEGEGIEQQKEAYLEVTDFDAAISSLNILGFTKKAFQETKREIWTLDGATITIDSWPFLDTFIEIEAENIETIKKVSKKLKFNYTEGFVGPVTNLYAKKYNLSADKINNKTPLIAFNMKNPFIA